MKIGVSSCLLGTNCRYDGKGAKDSFVASELSKYFEYVPVCPEGEIFPTPRDTIRLVETKVEGEFKAIIPAQENKDVTTAMNSIATYLVDELDSKDLCGFILKSKSPSCGLERVKVYQNDTSSFHEKKGVGFFAQKLKEKYPYLPIEEEGRLQDPWLKENFLLQVFAYKDLFEFLKVAKSFGELVEFHTSYKYLIYAKSQSSYKELGQIVANHDKYSLEIVLSKYKYAFLKAISIKDSISNTYNVIQHIIGYFKKQISNEEKHELLETALEYKDGIVPLIAVIKQINLYVKIYKQEYLAKQKFLHPYPKELALRSDIRAYK